MGNWESNAALYHNVIISDAYADAVEKYINMARDKLKKKFPEITGNQMAETISFVAGRLKLEK